MSNEDLITNSVRVTLTYDPSAGFYGWWALGFCRRRRRSTGFVRYSQDPGALFRCVRNHRPRPSSFVFRPKTQFLERSLVPGESQPAGRSCDVGAGSRATLGERSRRRGPSSRRSGSRRRLPREGLSDRLRKFLGPCVISRRGAPAPVRGTTRGGRRHRGNRCSSPCPRERPPRDLPQKHQSGGINPRVRAGHRRTNLFVD